MMMLTKHLRALGVLMAFLVGTLGALALLNTYPEAVTIGGVLVLMYGLAYALVNP